VKHTEVGAMRRSTREDWLREPEVPVPAYYANPYPLAPRKVQLAIRAANKRGIRVVDTSYRPRRAAVIKPRTGRRQRGHRPVTQRRASSSSSTSSQDPGEPWEPEPHSRRLTYVVDDHYLLVAVVA
jgi:hypothetical protein